MSSTQQGHDSELGPYFTRRKSDAVRWLPWKAKHFERATQEGKLIFVHLGRHLHPGSDEFAQRAFSDKEVVELLNQNFVCLAVDVDEEPLVQNLIASVALALGRTPALPAQVLLSPEGKPFFATGPLAAHGEESRPGLLQLLGQVLKLRKESPEEFARQSETLDLELERRCAPPHAAGSVSDEVLRGTFLGLGRNFDSTFYGFGAAPKFAQAPALRFLLNYAARHAHREAKTMALLSLGAMSAGGFFDQLSGGFFHQSRDRKFLVPHFDKHLGDNAQLIELYLDAFAVTGHVPLRRIAAETADFLIESLGAPEGGFFTRLCSEDRDGRYYLWTRRQLKQTLGEPMATHFAQFYGVPELGTDQKPPPLTATRSLAQVAQDLGLDPSQLSTSLEGARVKLRAQRNKRHGLLIDDRLITVENALVISALARAALLLGTDHYLEHAQRTAERFLDANTPDGLLPHRLGALSPGSLDDQVFFIQALVQLHQVTQNRNYLERALQLAQVVLQHYGQPLDPAAPERGINLLIAPHDEDQKGQAGMLRHLPVPVGDTGHEQAAGVLARALTQLGYLSGRADLLEQAKLLLAPYSSYLRRAPYGACSLADAADWMLEAPILVSAPKEDPASLELLQFIQKDRAHHVLILPEDETPSSFTWTKVTSLEDYQARLPELVTQATKNRRRELLRRVHSGRWVSTKKNELKLGPLGLGSYRIGLDKAAHAQAAVAALQSGIHIMDSSPSFALGDSQRLLGEVLDEQLSKGTVQRGQLFVISKLGVAVGQEAEELERQRKADEELPFTVPLKKKTQGDDKDQGSLSRGAFSLEPRFIRQQIELSLARLGLDHLDACLINSPEHLLENGANQEELEKALRSAFAVLEEEVEKGHIGRYGVVSTALVPHAGQPLLPGHKYQIVLEDLINWADAAAPGTSHFEVIEAPVNLIEDEAIKLGEDSLFALAKAKGLTTIACRPLSAITDGVLLRLTEVPESPDGAKAQDLAAAKYKVASLEAEFETTFAVQLRLAKQLGQEPLLPFSGPVGAALEHLATRQQFEQAETTLITPRLRSIVAQLDRAFVGQAPFQSWKAKYIQAVGVYLACLREECSEKNRALLSDLEERMLRSKNLDAPQAWAELKWPERALAPLVAHPHIDVVLVGARSASQVDTMTGLLPPKP